MDKKMNFKYFYGTEADQFSFYRIPKALFTNDCFKDLSSDAKILYGLMLDRMSLSIKNQWFDEENRAYIYFSIEDIMELLNCGRNKAVKSLQELDDEKGIGLIEKRRQGFGKVTIIYVKSFIQEECEEQKKEKPKMVKFTNQTSVEEEKIEEVYISNFKKSQKQTSRSPENKLQEVYISNSNNTNINNTNLSENKSNHIVSADGMGSEEDEMETLHAYQSLIKENLDYDSLLVSHPHDKNQIDEIVDLIVETVMCKSDKVLIASNWYSGALVRGKFMKLDYSHVEYVLHWLEGNTSKIKNIKKYLLAALFNAPSTISGYYRAEVNHDMPWLARYEDRYGYFKSGRKSVIDSIVVYHFDHRCRSEAASTYGGNRKKDIGIGNYGVVHRNSDLLPRLAPGSFSGLYGRRSDLYFICRRIYRYCNRLT